MGFNAALATRRIRGPPSIGPLKTPLPVPSSPPTAIHFPSGDHDGLPNALSDSASGRRSVPSEVITCSRVRLSRRMEKQILRPSAEMAGAAVMRLPWLGVHNSVERESFTLQIPSAPPLEERYKK